jgi:hypothetical protein
VRDTRGRDLIDTRVSVDGQAVLERLDGKPLLLNPGSHTITAQTARGETIVETVLAIANEKNRLVDLLAPGAREPSPETPSAGVGTVPWILGGIGVLGLGAFAYFELAGQSQYRDLRDGCAPTHACSDRDVDAARTNLVLGVVSLGVALVSLGVATWLFLSPSHGRRADAVRTTPKPPTAVLGFAR